MPHREGDDSRNVLLNEMNKPFTEYALDQAAMERWEKIILFRDVVNAELEKARNEKKIGKSLEAKVILGLRKEDTFFAEMNPEELADILIVSQVETEMVDLSVANVEPAQGQKCERCWKVLPTVGSNSKHPTLCPRCAKVVPAVEVE